MSSHQNCNNDLEDEPLVGPHENDDNISTGHEMKQGPGSTPDEQHRLRSNYVQGSVLDDTGAIQVLTAGLV